MESFILSNPFPSYQQMTQDIEDYPDFGLSMAMYAEFGRRHYEVLKAAYESGMKREAIRHAGQVIYDLGGMQAMQMNFYAFAHFSPFRNAKHDPDVFYAYKELEYGWDGIGQWAA